MVNISVTTKIILLQRNLLDEKEKTLLACSTKAVPLAKLWKSCEIAFSSLEAAFDFEETFCEKGKNEKFSTDWNCKLPAVNFHFLCCSSFGTFFAN